MTMADHSNDNADAAALDGQGAVSLPEPFVDLEAVAAFLGLTKATLEKWRFRNELPFPVYRIGRRLRFRLSEVDAWARSQATQSAA
jgi:excisionase family DNA binding protein